MSVKVKGLSSKEDSESNPDIEQIYQKHGNVQVLFNPANQFKAMRKLQKGPGKGSREAKSVSNGILAQSKRIKKDKKAADSSKLKDKKAAQ